MANGVKYLPPQVGDSFQLYRWQLDNGLKVYFSKNESQPNFYSEIVVKSGSSNDPADATGLAHYLEHLLFKGTNNLGTVNSTQEDIYQKQVEKLYVQLFHERDEVKEKEILKQIDQASVKGAQYVVFNEMSNLYNTLGASNLNAHTWVDETVYKVQMPKNYLKQWAQVEYDRFTNPVFRLFQWELEVVYEEKNRDMDNPDSRIWREIEKNLWAGHPYGDQSIIGTVEHLKNPPIHKVREYFNTYYVPNNMAVMIAGDLEPEQVIKVVNDYFGEWKAKEVESRKLHKVKPLKSSIVKELKGPGEPSMTMGFQVSDSQAKDLPEMTVFSKMLDTRLGELVSDNKIKSGDIWSFPFYYGGILYIIVKPLPGQSLGQLKNIVLSELRKLKTGQFSEELFAGSVLAAKANYEKSLETNLNRVQQMRDSFVLDRPWGDIVNWVPSLLKLNPSDISSYANKYINDKYIVVNYRPGKYQAPKVSKPAITPLTGMGQDKDTHSKMYFEIMTGAKKEPKIPYKPVNIQNQVRKSDIKEGVFLYTSNNPYNNQAEMRLSWEVNSLQNKETCFWMDYLDKSRTPKLTMVELKRKLFAKGLTLEFECDRWQASVNVDGEESHILWGLTEVLSFIDQIRVDKKILKSLVQSEIESRKQQLTDPRNLTQLVASYLANGSYSAAKLEASNDELKKVSSEGWKKLYSELLKANKNVFYVGKMNVSIIEEFLSNKIPQGQKSVKYKFPEMRSTSYQSNKNKIYIYDVPGMAQTHIHLLRSLFPFDEKNLSNYLGINFYNYFLGAGMSSPVFKEVREKRALAYSAYMYNERPFYEHEENLMRGFVGTQTDKFEEAFKTSRWLLDEYKMSEVEYSEAKKSFSDLLATSRLEFRDLPLRFFMMSNLGLHEDTYDLSYDYLQSVKMKDVESLVKEFISSKPFVFALVGDKKHIKLSAVPSDYEIIELKKSDLVSY